MIKLKSAVWPSLAVALFVLGLWLGKQGGQVGSEEVKSQTVASKSVQTKTEEVKEKVTKPDGTVTEKTTTVTKTVDKEQSKETVVASKDTKGDTIRISALARVNYPQLLPPTFGLGVERRLWDSPVWAGIQVYQDYSVALSVSVTF